MSTHISDDLPRLLTGEARRDEVLGAAAHLRTCPDCQQELVSAVVAHAALTSAQRYAPEVAAARPSTDVLPEEPLPDLTPVFAKAREEAARDARRGRPAHRRGLAVAAAAVVLAGGGVAAAELLGSGASTSPVAETVTLRPVGDVHASATATITGDAMRIDASALPKLDASRQYEVWLADGAGHRLRPVGYIGADRTAELPVPKPVRSQYGYIAISVQKTDQVQFSGDMVVRGQYG